MPRPRLAATAAALAALAGASAAHAQSPPTGDDALLVYDANVENLPTNKDHKNKDCRGDWRTLVSSMTSFAPDLMTVQQVDGNAQAGQLARLMRTQTGGVNYGWLVTTARAKKGDFPCGKRKERQTNAIIYRTDRLAPVQKSIRRWHPKRGAQCTPSNQPRTRAVSAVFEDLARKKNGRKAFRVYAASIHWPSGNKKVNGHPCAGVNAQQTVKRATAQPAALRIVGGDTNIKINKGGWFAQLTPFAEALGGGNPDRRDVLLATRTVQGPGIFSFASEVDWHVPAHKAIRARVQYSP